MKVIVRALGVSRSNLLEQRKARQQPQPTPTPPATEATAARETGQNAALLSRIRELVLAGIRKRGYSVKFTGEKRGSCTGQWLSRASADAHVVNSRLRSERHAMLP